MNITKRPIYYLLVASPILLFIILSISFISYGVANSVVFDPPTLFPVLNALFLFACPVLIIYIACKSFMETGLLSFLFLQCGAISIAVGSLLGGLIFSWKGPNTVITIHNSSMLLGGIFHLIGSGIASKRGRIILDSPRRSLMLFLTNSGTLLFLVILMTGTLYDWFPVFFIQGIGPSLIRQVILGSSIIGFLVSGSLFLHLFFKSRSLFLYWYAAALFLICLGLCCIFFEKHFGDPICWLGRISQYLAGGYLVIAVFHGAKESGIEVLRTDKILAKIFRNRFEILLEERTRQLTQTNARLDDEIKHRQRVEKALRESEDRFRKLFENNAAIMMIFDPITGNIVKANEAASEFYGWSIDEMSRMKIYDINMQPIESLSEKIQLTLSMKKIYWLFQHRRADGSIRDVEVFGSTIELEQETFLCSIVHDITERKISETMLKNSKRRFDQLAEQSRTIIWEVNASGLYTFISNVSEIVLGYHPDEVIGRLHFYDFFPENRRHKLQESIFKAFQRNESFVNVESILEGKDGRTVWVSINGIPVKNNDGSLRGYRGSSTDITAQKQANDRLKEYEKVVEGLEEMIAVVDKDYRYIIGNHALLCHLNLEREQFLGRTIPEILGHQFFNDYVKNNIDTSFQGSIVKFEVKYCYPLLGEREIFVTYLPIKGHQTVDRVAVILHDTTEQNRSQRELEKYRIHLEDAVKERTADLAIAITDLNHEIKERANVENLLRESEIKYRTLVEQIPAITYIIGIKDNDQFFLHYVSPQIESILGYTSEEAILDRRLKSKMLHPDDRAHVLNQIASFKQKIDSFFCEYRMIKRDGSIKWFRDEASVVYDASDNPKFIHGVMIDISDMKKMEEELRYSEKLYRTVFETTGTAMFLIEEDSTIALANAQVEKYTRLAKHEIEGKKKWMEFIHENDLERLKSYQKLRIIDSTSAPLQYQAMIADNHHKIRHVLITVSIVPETKKRVASILDITNLKETKKNLEQTISELENIQCITRNLLQQDNMKTVLYLIAKGIVANLGYSASLVVHFLSKEQLFTDYAVYSDFTGTDKNICGQNNDAGFRPGIIADFLKGRHNIMNRILNGEIIIDDTLSFIFEKFFSSRDALQKIPGGSGYIALPMRVQNETVGVILAGWDSNNRLDLANMQASLERVADLAAMAVKSAGLFATVDFQKNELKNLNIKLQKVEEEERKKIAQEIHDRVGQNLTGLSINLGIFKSIIGKDGNKKVQDRIADSIGLVSNTMECIRDIMSELHPTGLMKYGLPAALKDYCNRLSKRTKLIVAVESPKKSFLLKPDFEFALFRIAQEALTNVVKHAKATQSTVGFKVTENRIILSITDNGVGFNDKAFSLSNGGFGLISMRERAESVNGKFQVTSAPDEGTNVIVELDLET